MTGESQLLSPIIVPCGADDLDGLMSKEWLLANKIGAYASSTVIGANSRRYHGLLVAATAPPVGRVATLSTVMEQVFVDGQMYELASNEFAGTFSPRGCQHLVEFRNDVAATFIYRFAGVELVKEIILAESANAVAVRYTARGKAVSIRIWPFAAMRDFHGLRKVEQPHQMTFELLPDGLAIQDRRLQYDALHVTSKEAKLSPRPQWWNRFLYRADIARGQDGFEDLYTPGCLCCDLSDGASCQVTASLGESLPLDFSTMLSQRRQRLEALAASVAWAKDEATCRLAAASDAFVVQRHFPNAPPSPTILAGFHWFADWGRDAFIALPGLLLSTARMEQARGVFRTFASYIQQGMVPNRFDDYSPSAHYNSIDASLWFIVAGERYLQATNDLGFWSESLLPACKAILRAFHDGTMFDIRADADGLLTGGSPLTQLTWMDAKLGQEVITPRHGKAVEVNALWYAAHRIAAARSAGIDESLAGQALDRAELIEQSFRRAFWNADGNCLYDCIIDGAADASVRPNQILAVSLPYSPLDRRQQQAVVETVRQHLFTPMGLRTLAPFDGRYRRRYGGSWESRDRAYHQGTVWAWLIGPFIEAYLKVHDYSAFAVEQARQWLGAFDEHLRQAGIGYVSEIFDGDPPHTPRGCIAQAWSVAEILRLKLLVAQLAGKR